MRGNRKQFVLAAAIAGAVVGIRAGSAGAAQVVWTGAGASDNWSDAANFGGTPVAGNDVVFDQTDVQGAQGTVNNIVDTSLTINSLIYDSLSSGSTFVATLGFHTTQIDAGRTLTISGTAVGTAALGPVALRVGREVESGPAARATVSFVGGGSLVVNSPTADIQIRQGSTNSGAHYALMDLSQLANFTANVDQLTVGFNTSWSAANPATGLNRTSGRLLLGDVTNLTANNTGQSIVVGGTNSNSGDESQIELGRLTTFNAAQMTVGNLKANGRVYFRAGQTDPVFTLRGAAGGTSRMNVLGIGDNSTSGNTSGALTGRMDLTGGAADFRVNTLYVGKSPTGGTATGTPMNLGFLTLEKGTIDVNALEVGFQSFASGYGATGTINLSGTGEIVVNNNARLGRTVGGAGATAAVLNLSGGALRVFGNIVTEGGTSTVNLTGGTIDMQPTGDATPGSITVSAIDLNSGTLRNASTVTANAITIGAGLTVVGTPTYEITNNGTLDLSLLGTMNLAGGGGVRGTGAVNGSLSAGSGVTVGAGNGTSAGTLTFNNDLSLNDSTLRFKLSGDATPGGGVNDLISVLGSLSLSGTTAVVIDALGTGPATGVYRLIDYGTLASGSAANLVPAGLATQTRGTFTINGTTAGQINLVVESGTPQSLVWKGNASNKWNVVGDVNWLNGATPDKFFQQDTVTFDDSSTNAAAVDLTDVVSPAALTFNAARNYTVTGAGTIIGGASLTKDGTGTLVLANTGVNTYTGPTTINAGTLQVGNGGTGGSLGTGDVNNNGVLRFNRSDAVTVSSVISGAGAVHQDGAGTLTLGGANGYAGGLTVNAGAVRLTNASAGGSGTIRVNTGGLIVFGAAPSNPITLAGGTLGVTANTTLSGDITAAAGTTTTFRMTDPQNLPTGTADVNEIIWTGTLSGSGNVVILSNGTDVNPDGGNGFRLRGAGESTFSGNITVGNTVKFELQSSSTAGSLFSPAGTGKIFLTGGTYTGSLQGTYAQLLLRNLTGGEAVFGNNVEISGTGFATLNPTNTVAPDGAVSTLGNLRIGGGQILGVNKNTSPPVYTVAFQSVTLTGGNATFAPQTVGFGSTGSGTANLTLGPIGEAVAGSGIVMDGQALTTLSGVNTYTGPTQANRGTLRITGSVATSSGVSVGALGTLDVAATQTMKQLSIAAGGSAVVSAGVLTVGNNATAAPFANAGLIDVKARGMAIDTSPGGEAAMLAAVRAQVFAGYGGGSWAGATGITSADAALDAASRGVGYAAAADVLGAGGGTFMGVPVDGSSVLVRYTLMGDATLDGNVDFNDLVKLAQNYNTIDGSRTWGTGDFTYDGGVDFNDLVKLAQNYNTALPSEPVPGAPAGFEADLAAAFASVPEPGALGLVGVAACGLAGRRRLSRA